MAKSDISFLDVFESSTHDDLDAVREQIKSYQAKLAGLEAVERALDRKLNGKKERAKPTKKSTPSSADSNGEPSPNLIDKRRKVAAFITANGQKSRTKIAESVGISTQGMNNINTVLDCDWFHVSPEGMVTLTVVGERANPVLRGGVGR